MFKCLNVLNVKREVEECSLHTDCGGQVLAWSVVPLRSVLFVLLPCVCLTLWCVQEPCINNEANFFFFNALKNPIHHTKDFLFQKH